MEAIEHVNLSLRPPKHGWLPVRLELDAFVIDCSASNVLNDPLAELVDAVAFCSTPVVGRYRVCLWLEPQGYAIDILPGTSWDRCIFRVYFDGTFVPPMPWSKMDLIFQGEADLESVRGALLKELAQFVEQVDPAVLKDWDPRRGYGKRIAELQTQGSRRPGPHDKNTSPVGWYVASYLLRFVELQDEERENPERRFRAWENTVLIQAESPGEAFDKATAIGREAGQPYQRGREGVPVQWQFEGITSVLPIYEPLEDGVEIEWVEHAPRALKNLRKWVHPKEHFYQ